MALLGCNASIPLDIAARYYSSRPTVTHAPVKKSLAWLRIALWVWYPLFKDFNSSRYFIHSLTIEIWPWNMEAYSVIALMHTWIKEQNQYGRQHGRLHYHLRRPSGIWRRPIMYPILSGNKFPCANEVTQLRCTSLKGFKQSTQNHQCKAWWRMPLTATGQVWHELCSRWLSSDCIWIATLNLDNYRQVQCP